MPVCSGKGDSGDHCCYIRGEVCEALFIDRAGTPRCPFIARDEPMTGNPEWEALPVGQWFAETYPGYDCKDWPQNIPNVTGGLCCWKDE